MSAGALYSSCPFTSKEQIRILRLAPALNLADDLHGELEVRSFERLPKYEALSYTWQPPFEDEVLPDSAIWFFGYPLAITGNLSNGLRRIRRKDKERMLWVDAVCIDQENPFERNHQAGIMAEIYSKAFRVLAWLGEDSAIRYGSYTLESLATSDVDTFAVLGTKESPRNVRTSPHEAFQRQHDERTLFHTFTRRRFFRRRWVLQELILAWSVEMICGSYYIPWNIFAAALSERCRPERNAVASAHPLRPLLDLVQSIWKFQAGSSDTFLETMRQFENTSCEDDRDRICALTHIRKFPELRKFHADYSLSCEQFYCAFAASVRRASIRDFEKCLRLAALQRAEHEIPLASWVPDWRIRVQDSIPKDLADSLYVSQSGWFTTTDRALQDDYRSDLCRYATRPNNALLAQVPSYKFSHFDDVFHCFHSDEQEYSREIVVGPPFCILNAPNNDSGQELALVLRDYDLPQGQFRIAGVCSLRRIDKKPVIEMVDVVIV